VFSFPLVQLGYSAGLPDGIGDITEKVSRPFAATIQLERYDEDGRSLMNTTIVVNGIASRDAAGNDMVDFTVTVRQPKSTPFKSFVTIPK
jgi:hypothetical protein